MIQTGVLNLQGGGTIATQSGNSLNTNFSGPDYVNGTAGNFTGLTNGSPYNMGYPANNGNFVAFSAEL
jgi:hypothetical protein